MVQHRVHRPHNFRALSKPKPISKSDHKHYWPYLPVLLLVIGVFLITLSRPLQRQGVLSYTSDLSNQALLDSTNQARHQNQLSDLQINPELNKAAQAKADDMIKRDYWSHYTPDNQPPWYFMKTAGYNYQKAGENLAYGFNDSQAVITAWMNSETHRENILDGNYSEVGFGFANGSDFNNAGPETVVVAMYGKPAVLGASETPVVQASPTLSSEPTQAVSRIELLARSQLPWATFAIGLISGLAIMLLLIKHAAGVRHIIRDGERFVLHHPLLDTVLVGIVLAATFLSQTSGFIK